MSRANIQVASLPTAALGVLLAAKNQADIIDPSIFLYIFLFFTALTYSCHVNCLNDLAVDEKYKKNLSDAVKSLSIPTLKKIMSIELLIAGIIIISLCFLKKDIIYSLAFLGVICGYIYSAPPLRVKKRGILSPLPVMFGLYFLPIIAGWFIVNGRLSVYIIIFGLGYALIMQGITFINNHVDYGRVLYFDGALSNINISDCSFIGTEVKTQELIYCDAWNNSSESCRTN